jgi:hypothetical protein
VGGGGDDADDGVGEGGAGAAIEDVALDLGAVLEGEGDVTAVIECFFEGFVDLGGGGQRWDPAFEIFALTAGGDLELVWGVLVKLLDFEVFLPFGGHRF